MSLQPFWLRSVRITVRGVIAAILIIMSKERQTLDVNDLQFAWGLSLLCLFGLRSESAQWQCHNWLDFLSEKLMIFCRFVWDLVLTLNRCVSIVTMRILVSFGHLSHVLNCLLQYEALTIETQSPDFQRSKFSCYDWQFVMYVEYPKLNLDLYFARR